MQIECNVHVKTNFKIVFWSQTSVQEAIRFIELGVFWVFMELFSNAGLDYVWNDAPNEV